MIRRQVSTAFDGRRVLTLEGRRAPELALLVVNYGGDPMIAPALREIPLESNLGALAFANGLIHGEYDVVVLMTGIGTRLLVRLSAPVHGDAFVAALREIGISPWLTAPSPNTWHEVITTLDSRAPGACSNGTRGGDLLAAKRHVQ